MLFFLLVLFYFLLSVSSSIYGLVNAIRHIMHHKDYALSSVVASIVLMLLLQIPICVLFIFR